MFWRGYSSSAVSKRFAATPSIDFRHLTGLSTCLVLVRTWSGRLRLALGLCDFALGLGVFCILIAMAKATTAAATATCQAGRVWRMLLAKPFKMETINRTGPASPPAAHFNSGGNWCSRHYSDSSMGAINVRKYGGAINRRRRRIM